MILGCQEQFIPAILAGTKLHSIRKGNRWREGMTIHFYEKVRQKGMAKFRADAVARQVQKIRINGPSREQKGSQPSIVVEGRRLTPLESQELSIVDGFKDFDELLTFFRKEHKLPFSGQLIGWTYRRY